MNVEFKMACERLQASLKLERQPVGVKFLFTEQDYLEEETPQLRVKTPYCVMVKMASKGFAYKTTLELSKCGGGTRALGLEPPSEAFMTGEEYHTFGIYKDLEISRQVARQLTFCSRRTWGVVTKPLSDFKEIPDVVLLTTTPYNAMRIIQGYTYTFGALDNFKMAGNQAVCAEATAYPYERNTLNVSMLCAGTRYLSGWNEEEMAVGVSGKRFIGLSDGIYYSVNGAENNQKKAHILEELKNRGLEDPGIKMDGAYFIAEMAGTYENET